MRISFHLTHRKAEAWPLPAQIYVAQTPYHTHTLHFGPHFYSFTLFFSSPCSVLLAVPWTCQAYSDLRAFVFIFLFSLPGVHFFSSFTLWESFMWNLWPIFCLRYFMRLYVLIEVTRTLLANATSRFGLWPHITEYGRIMSKVITYVYRVLCVTRFLPILFPAKL